MASGVTDFLAVVGYYCYCLVVDVLVVDVLVAGLRMSDPTHAVVPLYGWFVADFLVERWDHENSLAPCRLRNSSTNVRYHKYADLSSFLSPNMLATPPVSQRIRSFQR